MFFTYGLILSAISLEVTEPKSLPLEPALAEIVNTPCSLITLICLSCVKERTVCILTDNEEKILETPEVKIQEQNIYEEIHFGVANTQ